VIALKNPSLRVTVIDRDAFRIRRWKSAHLPLHEPGLIDIVRATRDGLKELGADASDGGRGTTSTTARRPNLFFSTDTAKCIAEADVIFICVNTNTKMSGIGAGLATDMTALESAVREVAVNAKSRAILVEKSTVPCRTASLVKEIVSFPWPAPLSAHDKLGGKSGGMVR
jgi:UDPglucose 6-dehydrogenase